MKYICLNLSCNHEFDESSENKEINSKLIRMCILKCPNCGSNVIELSKQGKLLVERKAKIDKIENNKTK